MSMFELIYVLLQAVAWIAVIIAGWATCCLLISLIERAVLRRRRKRRAEIEALLNQKQAELRRAVIRLAEALAEERLAATDASKQMVARAYLTTGRVPYRREARGDGDIPSPSPWSSLHERCPDA